MPKICQTTISIIDSLNEIWRLKLAKVVNCPCGEAIKADDDDKLVELVQKHGKETHNQEVSRDDALAMAQPAD